jgi:serine/threonine protein kinase
MNETWKKFEGKVVGGKFRLQKYVGHSNHSVVFLTEREGPTPLPAVVKLIACEPEREPGKLAQWVLASTLSHPHLLQIFEAGRWELDGHRMLYVVMEFAEESLADVPPERRLSPAETEEILPPVLNALTYLHGQNLVHGHIKPSNIMAAADQVKLSTDSVRAQSEAQGEREASRPASPYDAPETANGIITPASDVWALGKTLAEVSSLPQQGTPIAGSVPDPLFNLVSHLLEASPQRRWMIARISSWLDRPVAGPKAEEVRSESNAKPTKWIVVSAVVAVLLLLVFLALRLRQQSPRARIEQTKTAAAPPATSQPKAEPEPPPSRRRAASDSGRVTPPVKTAKAPSAETIPDAIQQRVLPTVAPSARRTIQGHIRVATRVSVDAGGNVVSVTLDNPGPSAYFARLASGAARDWKFSPGHSSLPREWVLHFVFSRGGTDVNAVPVGP